MDSPLKRQQDVINLDSKAMLLLLNCMIVFWRAKKKISLDQVWVSKFGSNGGGINELSLHL